MEVAPPPKKYMREFKIQANRFDFSKRYEGNIKENSSNIYEQMNIMTKDKVVHEKIKKLVGELDREEDGLHSLFSRSSNDIGCYTNGIAPYKPVIFEFPIVPNADLTPMVDKTRFINPNLEEQAIKMLIELTKIGVIKRGYSPWSCNSVYVPKPAPEMSLKEHLEQGGTSENFISGTINKNKAGGIRMTQNFRNLNKTLLNCPINQLNPSAQVRRICRSTKYISIIDISGAYHTICLSKNSSKMTGFHSGISSLGSYFYLRTPMGCSVSQNFLNSALLHALSGIEDIMLYSDNILLISTNKDDH